MKITVENAAEPTTTGLPQACSMSSPIPPVTKPMAANTQEVLASNRVASFPRSFENAHDPSGQTIPA
ncbi:MAG: hypothetical protein MUO40_04480 [Anaerolineaceae bacterium]|nr:hypothetical protein [Anaerolineaceae bacterium]